MKFEDIIDLRALVIDGEERAVSNYRIRAVIAYIAQNNYVAHYVTYVRPDDLNGNWVRLDDGNVTVVTSTHVHSEVHPYVLLYEKTTVVAEGSPTQTEYSANLATHPPPAQTVEEPLESTL